MLNVNPLVLFKRKKCNFKFIDQLIYLIYKFDYIHQVFNKPKTTIFLINRTRDIVLFIYFLTFLWTDSSACSTVHWERRGGGEGGEVPSINNMLMNRKLICLWSFCSMTLRSSGFKEKFMLSFSTFIFLRCKTKRREKKIPWFLRFWKRIYNKFQCSHLQITNYHLVPLQLFKHTQIASYKGIKCDQIKILKNGMSSLSL